VFQRSKVNPKLLVGESEYIKEHFAVHGQNALFPEIKVFFAVPSDTKTRFGNAHPRASKPHSDLLFN
jgi:hypothetical protein